MLCRAQHNIWSFDSASTQNYTG